MSLLSSFRKPIARPGFARSAELWPNSTKPGIGDLLGVSWLMRRKIGELSHA